MVWEGVDKKKSLTPEANNRAKSLAVVANDCHCLVELFLAHSPLCLKCLVQAVHVNSRSLIISVFILRTILTSLGRDPPLTRGMLQGQRRSFLFRPVVYSILQTVKKPLQSLCHWELTLSCSWIKSWVLCDVLPRQDTQAENSEVHL